MPHLFVDVNKTVDVTSGTRNRGEKDGLTNRELEACTRRKKNQGDGQLSLSLSTSMFFFFSLSLPAVHSLLPEGLVRLAAAPATVRRVAVVVSHFDFPFSSSLLCTLEKNEKVGSM